MKTFGNHWQGGGVAEKKKESKKWNDKIPFEIVSLLKCLHPKRKEI
jgi:hypothetical protein